jgi:energy-coupling factor transport system substrate-specific component
MYISAQISLYPLRQDRLSPAIREMQDVLVAAGLDVAPGPMSTLVTGDGAAVFDALKESFLRAAATGHVVMTATVSNACPV